MKRLALVLTLSGCAPALRLEPATFPDAHVGQRYELVVNVKEAHTPVGNVETLTLPPGLTLSHKDHEDAFTISGVPTTAGDFSVVIDGWCYGTNFRGQQLHKELVLHVR